MRFFFILFHWFRWAYAHAFFEMNGLQFTWTGKSRNKTRVWSGLCWCDNLDCVYVDSNYVSAWDSNGMGCVCGGDSDGMDCGCVTVMEWIVFVWWLWNGLCLCDGCGMNCVYMTAMAWIVFVWQPGLTNAVKDHIKNVENSLGVSPHKQSIAAMLQPGHKLRIKIGFQPRDDLARSSLILIRYSAAQLLSLSCQWL